MSLALLRPRPGPVKASFSFARSLSGPSRNRTWSLPSPSPSSTISDTNASEQRGAPPVRRQPQKKISKITRDTNVKTWAETRKIPQGHLRNNVQLKPHKPARRDTLSAASAKPGSSGKRTEKSDEAWVARKAALKAKYPEGWRPGRKISPEAMEGIRILHRQVNFLLCQN